MAASRGNAFGRKLAPPVTERTRKNGPLPLPVALPPKLTRRTAASFQERMYRAHLPEALQTWWTAFIGKLQSGDQKTIDLGARIFGLDQRSGININLAANANANAQAASASKALPQGVNGFEFVLRQFEQRKREEELAAGKQLALPAPAEVIEAEVEEIPQAAPISVEDLLP
jgi:hypothetical protein